MSTPPIVHLDEHLIVVVKPAGLLAVPGRGEAGRDNLAVRLQTEFPDALTVHRLDMATSGLMVFARGAAAHRTLSLAFEKRRVGKRYVAVVEGQVAGESGEVDLPLIVDWPRRPLQIVDHARGRPALTRWQVLSRDDETTRLTLLPHTGRTHQLRVHMQQIGHPIRGDEFYAPLPLKAPRLLLHACHLAFAHPATGQALAFDDAAPF